MAHIHWSNYYSEGIIKDLDLADQRSDEWHPLKLIEFESQPQIEGRSIEEHLKLLEKLYHCLREERSVCYDLVCMLVFLIYLFYTIEGLEIDYEGDLQLPDWAQGIIIMKINYFFIATDL